MTKRGSFLSLLPFSPHISPLSVIIIISIWVWVMVHCELTAVVCKITIKLGKPSNRKEFRSRYILQDFVKKMVAWCSKFEPIQSFIRYGFGRNRLQNVFKLLNWELPFFLVGGGRCHYHNSMMNQLPKNCYSEIIILEAYLNIFNKLWWFLNKTLEQGLDKFWLMLRHLF